MTNQFSEVTRVGYFGRLKNAIVGVIFGVILLGVGSVLLFWNEGRAVKTAQMLKEGTASVVSTNAETIQPGNEGKLVHFTGNATGQSLTDPLFQVSATAIQLKRVAELYQWQETSQTNSHQDVVGGGQETRTNYTYKTIWSDTLIDSQHFHVTSEHVNPVSKRVDDKLWMASPVKVGAFTLPPELVTRVDNFASLPLQDGSHDQLPADLKDAALISDGACYISGRSGRKVDPGQPLVGDLRITLMLAAPGPVSVIARQSADSLSAYPTRSGKALELLYVGEHPAAEMFSTEQRHNTMLTWGLRLAGFFAIWFGLMAIVQPISVLVSVVGILGDVVGTGLGLLCFLLAVALASVIIALAWLVYRPLLGIGLLVVAAAAVVYLIARWRGRSAVGRPATVAVSR